MPPFPELATRVCRGLWGSLRRVGYLAAMAALIGLISLGISLPLWYFASAHRTGYTAAVLAVGAAALLLSGSRRTLRAVRAHGGVKGYLRGALLPILKAVGFTAASLAVLYAALLLVSAGRVVPGVIAAVTWILLLGFLKYGRKEKP